MISRVVFLVSMLLLLGASCVRVELTRDAGGVFVSTNAGRDWTSASTVLAAGATQSLSGQSLPDLVMDPQDSETLYVILSRQGFAVSHDGARSWRRVENFPGKEVSSLAVSPANVCAVYVASGVGIYKTSTCLRNWSTLYIDPRTSATVLSLAVESHGAVDTIFAGLSTGEVLVSTDSGQTWTAAARLESEVQKVLLSPRAGGKLFASTLNRGVLVSEDSGRNWESLNENLSGVLRPYRILDLQADLNSPGGLLALTDAGIFKKAASIRAWERIRIIPSGGSAPISAIALHPKEARTIYYVARGVLYGSADGGVSWKTVRLPTNRVVSAFLIDPRNPARMYMATTR